MRVKPEYVNDFEALHRVAAQQAFPGGVAFHLVKTADAQYSVIGEWESMAALAAARPAMIATLDRFRHMLVDLGAPGLTDPVSGEAVVSHRMAMRETMPG
jgi:quinol monooxygenase YgiN